MPSPASLLCISSWESPKSRFGAVLQSGVPFPAEVWIVSLLFVLQWLEALYITVRFSQGASTMWLFHVHLLTGELWSVNGNSLVGGHEMHKPELC